MMTKIKMLNMKCTLCYKLCVPPHVCVSRSQGWREFPVGILGCWAIAAASATPPETERAKRQETEDQKRGKKPFLVAPNDLLWYNDIILTRYYTAQVSAYVYSDSTAFCLGAFKVNRVNINCCFLKKGGKKPHPLPPNSSGPLQVNKEGFDFINVKKSGCDMFDAADIRQVYS